MTIAVSSNKQTWLANGSTVDFPYSFAMPLASDATLIYTDALGNQTTVAPGAYTLTGVGQPTAGGGPQGGRVTYAPGGLPIAPGTSLTLIRTVPLTQPNVFANQSGLWPATVEGSDDNLEMQLQQTAEVAGRSLQYNPADTGPFTPLPPAAVLANKFLGFDANGQPMVQLLVGLASVLPSVLTGLSTTVGTPITAADTVLSAFGKLQAEITALGVSTVLPTMLTGLNTSVGTPITSADSVLSAFGKLQGQVTLFPPVLPTQLTGLNTTSATPITAADTILSAFGKLQGQASAPTYVGTSTGSVSRLLSTKLGDLQSVADWGAKGDGVTDDTAALNLAIANCRGLLLWPAGSYKTSAPLVVNRSNLIMFGAGPLASVIVPAFATGNVITIGNGVNNPGNVKIDGIGQAGGVTRTSGNNLYVANGHGVTITNYVSYGGYNGVWFEGGASQFEYTLEGFEINGCTNQGLTVGGTAVVQDIWINRGVIASCNKAYVLGWVSGLHSTQVDIILAGTVGVFLTPVSGGVVTACFFTDVESDTGGGDGWLFGGLGTISNIVLNACWSCSNAQSGIDFVNANTSGVTITGSIVMNNRQHGIVLALGTNIQILGNQIFCNSQSASGVYSGIAVVGGFVGFTIQGNIIGLGGSIGLVSGNLQAYGIALLAGATGFYQILGNTLLNNVVAGISDGSTGSNRIIQENIGYVTQTAGQASIGSASTSVVVTHNLAGTPAAGDVMVCAASSLTSAKTCWPSAIGATTFTINLDVAPGATAFFNWWARLNTP